MLAGMYYKKEQYLDFQQNFIQNKSVNIHAVYDSQENCNKIISASAVYIPVDTGKSIYTSRGLIFNFRYSAS